MEYTVHNIKILMNAIHESYPGGKYNEQHSDVREISNQTGSN